MERVKKTFFYAILIIGFWLFSNFMIDVGLRNTYKTTEGEIKTTSPEIVVSEAKNVDVSGYVNGTIKNNSETDIARTYIKLDLYTKRNMHMGTEYVEILDLKVNETREFEIPYKYSRIDHYELTCVNEK